VTIDAIPGLIFDIALGKSDSRFNYLLRVFLKFSQQQMVLLASATLPNACYVMFFEH